MFISLKTFLNIENNGVSMYGYDSTEEFIENTNTLLSKLENEGIWNKDTLVIALDKAVRPLSFTMKKLSDLDGKETPKIVFLNYSSQDGKKSLGEYYESDAHLKSIVESLKNYKNVIVLDQHTHSGRTMDNVWEFLKDKSKNPELNYYFASYTTKASNDPLFGNKLALRKEFQELSDRPGKPVDEYIKELLGDYYERNELMLKNSHPLIYQKVDYDAESPSSDKTGIEDRVEKSLVSKRANSKEFIDIRKNLIKKIKEYVHEHKGVLEESMALSLVFLGIFIGAPSITGGVVGVSYSQGLPSILIVFLGLFILFVSRTRKVEL